MPTVTPADAHALIEALAVIEAGPVGAGQIAIDRDERHVERMLDEQVQIGRVKATTVPVRYELTEEGRFDLLSERLIFAVLAEFLLERADSVTSIVTIAAEDLGLAASNLERAASAALTEGWIASTGANDKLAATDRGRKAWSRARTVRPHLMTPLLAKYTTLS